MPHHTIPYRTIPYHTIPYHTIPYHTIPYHTIPYHTIPYHTIPYHTIPYHTIRTIYRNALLCCVIPSLLNESYPIIPHVIRTCVGAVRSASALEAGADNPPPGAKTPTGAAAGDGPGVVEGRPDTTVHGEGRGTAYAHLPGNANTDSC